MLQSLNNIVDSIAPSSTLPDSKVESCCALWGSADEDALNFSSAGIEPSHREYAQKLFVHALADKIFKHVEKATVQKFLPAVQTWADGQMQWTAALYQAGDTTTMTNRWFPQPLLDFMCLYCMLIMVQDRVGAPERSLRAKICDVVALQCNISPRLRAHFKAPQGLG